MTPDRRSHFANDRVAHSTLRGQVKDVGFSDGHLMRVAVPVADILAAPDRPRLERQTLFGQPVRVLDARAGFSFGRDESNGFVGWFRTDDLGDWIAPTHRVAVRATLLFDAPDIKSPRPVALSCGAGLAVRSISGRFAETGDGRFAIAAHLAPLDRPQPDLAATAMLLLGTPYLWGGNSAQGIDCSGLVQLACQAAGLPCPGDSDQQAGALGRIMAPGTPPRRNDLLFWKGHVALVCDAQTLVHANGGSMSVALEGIEAAVARIDEQGEGGIAAHRRLD